MLSSYLRLRNFNKSLSKDDLKKKYNDIESNNVKIFIHKEVKNKQISPYTSENNKNALNSDEYIKIIDSIL
jgi:hypothetical protein